MKLQTSTAAEYKKEFSPCFRHHVNERSRLQIHQVHVVLTPYMSRFLNYESELTGLKSSIALSVQHKGSALAAHRTRASQFVVGASAPVCCAARSVKRRGPCCARANPQLGWAALRSGTLRQLKVQASQCRQHERNISPKVITPTGECSVA